MSEYKHTPGPWLFEENGSTAIIYTLRPTLFAGLPTFENAWQAQFSQDGRHKTPIEEVFANARLAAAAPELLEALERTHAALHVIADYLKDKREIDPLLVIGTAQCAETVIKKAIGATP